MTFHFLSIAWQDATTSPIPFIPFRFVTVSRSKEFLITTSHFFFCRSFISGIIVIGFVVRFRFFSLFSTSFLFVLTLLLCKFILQIESDAQSFIFYLTIFALVIGVGRFFLLFLSFFLFFSLFSLLFFSLSFSIYLARSECVCSARHFNTRCFQLKSYYDAVYPNEKKNEKNVYELAVFPLSNCLFYWTWAHIRICLIGSLVNAVNDHLVVASEMWNFLFFSPMVRGYLFVTHFHSIPNVI